MSEKLLKSLTKKLEEKIPEKHQSYVRRIIDRLSRYEALESEEYHKDLSILEYIAKLPWNDKKTTVPTFRSVKRILDKSHHGVDDVKNAIIEYLAVVRLQKSRGKTPVLCLAGPPGVGKTSFAQSIADALKRPLARVFLGGMSDVSELKGFQKTFISPMPGKIIDSFARTGSKSPVILLDEIDKIGKKDVFDALLDVLDYAQNDKFKDAYVDIEFDISGALFIATANWLDAVPEPLKDRMEIIHLPSYTISEKVKIARQYIIPQVRDAVGLGQNDLRFEGRTLEFLIDGYTRESGVRDLSRLIGKVARKKARSRLEKRGTRTGKVILITPSHLRELLGPPAYLPESTLRIVPPGTVAGLAYNVKGGSVLMIETARFPKVGRTPKIQITGLPGEMTRESAQICISLLRSNHERLGIDAKEIVGSDIHIHYPATTGSGVDGPSAGIAMLLALVSLFTGKIVATDIAMTGEVDLRGNVAAIGGLREKLLASLRERKTRVLIPADNAAEMAFMPPEVKEGLKVIPVSTIWEALAEALPSLVGEGEEVANLKDRTGKDLGERSRDKTGGDEMAAESSKA